MGKASAGHYFNGGEAGPAHIVTHHLEEGEFLHGIGFGEFIRGVDFGFYFGNAR